jgi:LuxR family transcriptional regulator
MIFEQRPDVKSDLKLLRDLATSGFVVALNHRWIGPEYLRSEFPKKWRDVYEEQNYFMLDPIYNWTLFHAGTVRWSDVKYPDIRGIRKHAAEHGLVFGATVCLKIDRNTSFISAARPDREFTDDEIATILSVLERWQVIATDQPALSEVEMENMQCLRQGMDQHEIATHLGVSVSTVKKRLKKIRKLFKAATTAQALAIATERNYFVQD